MEPLEPEAEDQVPERKPGDPIVVKLNEPIQWGKDLIEVLTLKFNMRAIKDLSIEVTTSGGTKLNLYDLALAGVRMSGHPDGVFQKLGGSDVQEVAKAAQLFLS